ncbi:MAG: FAD-dependent oxidoreductase [Candidatus Saccharimonadales bacterium]
MKKKYSTVIIGGGFYGLSVALFLRDEMGIEDILVIEKESAMMSRASYVNQARVHMGYHYPRSILTAYRSAVNFPRFVENYNEAVVNDFDKYYAISKILSKINGRQFVEFSHKIGADIETAPKEISDLFNPRLTDGVYKVKEYAFDSHKLRDLLMAKIAERPGIVIHSNEEVQKISEEESGIEVITDKSEYHVKNVISCTYSQLNKLHRNSGIPLIPLKHEIAEMCLVKLPDNLKDFSVTMMDGPFFSIMPFPTRGLHTLSHVRYTPHESWNDNEDTPVDRHDTHKYFSGLDIQSNYKKMYADVVRYIPELKDMKLVDTISEVKTVLQKSEGDDSRPILFKSDWGIKNYTCIMGGKLDNIYDVFEDLKKLYAEK